MTTRSDKPDLPPPGDAEPPSFEIGHDGKIDGYYKAKDQRRAWTPKDAAQLALAAQKRPQGAELPAPYRQKASPRKALLAVAIIIAGVASPFLARWGVRAIRQLRAGVHKASGLIVIDSVPSNASVFIDGREVGRTPYVAPNTFEPGSQLPVRIVYPGAQEWAGTLPGGKDTSFTADLVAQPPPDEKK